MPRSILRDTPIAAILLLQACLLFPALGLLPVWGDELHTLTTTAHPPREIAALVRQDIHPPLYFILQHEWRKLPLPWPSGDIARLRAFSVLWSLLVTFILDVFWARRLQPNARWLAVALFAFSPCVLLYGRMARSYSMQGALSLLTLPMLERWLRNPRSIALALASLGFVVALLYTHYAPGLAILAGFALFAWRELGAVRAAAFLTASLVAYAPWLVTLAGALRQWGRGIGFAANYTLTGNGVLEHVLKIVYTLVALTIGESFETWSLLLVPMLLWVAFRGAKQSPGGLPLAAFALVGYIGVSRWVTYSFVAARLFWLAPFLCLAMGAGTVRAGSRALRSAILAAVAVSYSTSIMLYFHRTNFLNPAYTAPLPEIATQLERSSTPDSVILLDSFGMDYHALAAYLSGGTSLIPLDDSGIEEARRRFPDARRISIVRPVRDVSPGQLTTKVQAEACAGKSEHDTLFEPIPAWQQTALKLIGVQSPPTYFYEVIECAGRSSSSN